MSVDRDRGGSGRVGSNGGVLWRLLPDRLETIVAAAAVALVQEPLVGAPLLDVGLSMHVVPPTPSASGTCGCVRGGSGRDGSGGFPRPGDPDLPCLPLPALLSALGAAVEAATTAAFPRVVEPLLEVVVDVQDSCLRDVLFACADPLPPRGLVLDVDVGQDGGVDGGVNGGGGGGLSDGGCGRGLDASPKSRALLTARVPAGPVRPVTASATAVRSEAGLALCCSERDRAAMDARRESGRRSGRSRECERGRRLLLRGGNRGVHQVVHPLRA